MCHNVCLLYTKAAVPKLWVANHWWVTEWSISSTKYLKIHFLKVIITNIQLTSQLAVNMGVVNARLKTNLIQLSCNNGRYKCICSFQLGYIGISSNIFILCRPICFEWKFTFFENKLYRRLYTYQMGYEIFSNFKEGPITVKFGNCHTKEYSLCTMITLFVYKLWILYLCTERPFHLSWDMWLSKR